MMVWFDKYTSILCCYLEFHHQFSTWYQNDFTLLTHEQSNAGNRRNGSYSRRHRGEHSLWNKSFDIFFYKSFILLQEVFFWELYLQREKIRMDICYFFCNFSPFWILGFPWMNMPSDLIAFAPTECTHCTETRNW